jgi:hypothetical protein
LHGLTEKSSLARETDPSYLKRLFFTVGSVASGDTRVVDPTTLAAFKPTAGKEDWTAPASTPVEKPSI